MNDSVLISIKKLLGLGEEQTDFDQDIIMHINTVLANLVQMGVGPEEGCMITGNTETWASITGGNKKIEQIKSYVYLKVRKLFDPPANPTLMENIEKSASELEWRMYIEKGGY